MTETVEETKVQERQRGEKGVQGVATAALTIRQMWHNTCFQRENNGKKTVWVPNVGIPSLKSFARGLLRKGDQVAKDWFVNKSEVKNLKRSDANEKITREAALATKTERRKKSANNAAKKK